MPPSRHRRRRALPPEQQDGASPGREGRPLWRTCWWLSAHSAAAFAPTQHDWLCDRPHTHSRALDVLHAHLRNLPRPCGTVALVTRQRNGAQRRRDDREADQTRLSCRCRFRVAGRALAAQTNDASVSLDCAQRDVQSVTQWATGRSQTLPGYVLYETFMTVLRPRGLQRGPRGRRPGALRRNCTAGPRAEEIIALVNRE